jgi:glycosyltransferase involved in cell wall biosynthesis
MMHIYDNRSTDDTFSVISKLAENDIHIHTGKVFLKGKGNVYRRFRQDMLEMADKKDIFMMIDADYTYHPLRLENTLNSFKEEAFYDKGLFPVMYIGNRLGYQEQNKSLLHGFGNNLIRTLFKMVYHCDKDIFSGCRIFGYDFIKSFSPKGDGFELETEMTTFAIRNDYEIKEFSCLYTDRKEGKTKTNSIKDGIKIIWTFLNEAIRDYPAIALIPSFFIFLGLAKTKDK